jgi:hypothetical protein
MSGKKCACGITIVVAGKTTIVSRPRWDFSLKKLDRADFSRLLRIL